MEDWQQLALNQLEQSHYLPQLREMARHMCAPFWWSATVDGKAVIKNNGSVCFLNTGERSIGLTANHVLKSFEDAVRTRGDDIECQIGSSTIDPSTRIIDRDERLDLAILDLPDVFVGPAGGFVHTPRVWPTRRIQLQEVVLYGGYPGALREARYHEADFPFQSFAWAIADVSDRSVTMSLAFEQLYWPGHDGEQINQKIGGMSGGPVFRVVEGPIDRLELVGVICEQSVHEVVIARHTDFVLPNGQLVRS